MFLILWAQSKLSYISKRKAMAMEVVICGSFFSCLYLYKRQYFQSLFNLSWFMSEGHLLWTCMLSCNAKHFNSDAIQLTEFRNHIHAGKIIRNYMYIISNVPSVLYLITWPISCGYMYVQCSMMCISALTSSVITYHLIYYSQGVWDWEYWWQQH